MIGASISWPEDRARCCYGSEDECACPAMEKALRGWVRGDDMPSMTQEQRMFCLSEIGRVEGYDLADYTYATDRTLASGVLEAWTDYARDKGLL